MPYKVFDFIFRRNYIHYNETLPKGNEMCARCDQIARLTNQKNDLAKRIDATSDYKTRVTLSMEKLAVELELDSLVDV